MNPNRPTPTWVIALLGVAGGIAVAVYLFVTGQADGELQTGGLTRRLGQIGAAALLLAGGTVGGFTALRRKWRP